jgi:plasmid stability protein
MASVTVRNIPDRTHRALKLRAARHGRSTEAEIRSILDDAVRPRQRLGAMLAEIGRRVGGADLVIRRDSTPVARARFK